jgi:hypothetical protein
VQSPRIDKIQLVQTADRNRGFREIRLFHVCTMVCKIRPWSESKMPAHWCASLRTRSRKSKPPAKRPIHLLANRQFQVHFLCVRII